MASEELQARSGAEGPEPAQPPAAAAPEKTADAPSEPDNPPPKSHRRKFKDSISRGLASLEARARGESTPAARRAADAATPAESSRNEDPPEWLLENISEASRNARGLFYLFLGSSAYVLLTVVGTSDKQLLLGNKAKLPVIDLEVPFSGFFMVSPILLVMFFAYFQLYLQRINSLKADLDRYRSPAPRRLYPWMINMADDPDPGLAGWLQRAVVGLTLWGFLPVVLMVSQGWILRKRDFMLSAVLTLEAVVGLGIVLLFWWLYRPRPRLPLRGLIPFFLSAVLVSSNFLWPHHRLDLSFQKLIHEENGNYPSMPLADFRNSNLQHASFMSSLLKRASFQSANLQHAVLLKAFLDSANFQDANLNYARLEYASAKWAEYSFAQMRYANLEGANLTGAQLLYTRLERAKMPFSVFRQANLNYADLTGAAFAKSDFTGADMEYADLTRANAVLSNFTDSDLSNSDFASADLNRANFSRASFRNAKVPKANFKWANLTKASFNRAEMAGSVLSETILDSTDLSQAGLQRAALASSKGHGADFRSARLDSADLRDAEIRDSDFTLAHFRHANLERASLIRCNLRRSILDSANVDGTDFSSAALDSSSLKGCNITLRQLASALSFSGADLDSALAHRVLKHPALAKKWKNRSSPN